MPFHTIQAFKSTSDGKNEANIKTKSKNYIYKKISEFISSQSLKGYCFRPRISAPLLIFVPAEIIAKSKLTTGETKATLILKTALGQYSVSLKKSKIHFFEPKEKTLLNLHHYQASHSLHG